MKDYFLITFLLFSVYFLQAQIVNIPDSNFKNALIDFGVDINNDDEIQVSEAEAIVTLLVSNKNISSLEGIQSFINVLSLDCRHNQLTSLDLTNNVNLTHLYCSSNQLMNINVSQNLNLGILTCQDNQLTTLDVSQNSNLVGLNCSNNFLTDIDVSQNSNLGWFFCYSNQLSSLDVSLNSSLHRLGCNNNQLNNLNVKNGNNHNMVRMWAYDNPNLNCITVDDIDYANNQNCNDNDWCKDDWTGYNEDISEDCILDITELEYNDIYIYPNPVKDILNITSEIPFDILKIYNLQGQLINETKNNQIDVSLFSSGLYFASIVIDGKNIVKKFIKE